MAATITHYNYFKYHQLNGTVVDWNTDTIKLALCTSTYTPNTDTHEYMDNGGHTFITNELSGGGYSRATMTCTTTKNAGTTVTLDADNVSFANLTGTSVRYGIIYKHVGADDAANPLIAYVDFGANKTFTDATLTITWHTDGVSVIT